MRLFPKLPDGMGPLRKFNTLMVVVITSCLLGQRFYKHLPQLVQQLEVAITVAGIGLFIGVLAQFVVNRKNN